MELGQKSVIWKRLYRIINQGVQENIVILNVTIFCIQTKVFGNIKFCCLIITRFVDKTAIFFFSSSSMSKENTDNFQKVPHESRS